MTMDIRCKFCREPWDTDCVHDIADEASLTYDEAKAAFFKFGCGAFDCLTVEEMRPCRYGVGRPDPIIGMMQEVFGHDLDGMASDLEDAEMLGLI